MDSPCITNRAKTASERGRCLYCWYYLNERHLECPDLNYLYSGQTGGGKKRHGRRMTFHQGICRKIMFCIHRQSRLPTDKQILFFSRKPIPCKWQHFWWLCFSCTQALTQGSVWGFLQVCFFVVAVVCFVFQQKKMWSNFWISCILNSNL